MSMDFNGVINDYLSYAFINDDYIFIYYIYELYFHIVIVTKHLRNVNDCSDIINYCNI